MRLGRSLQGRPLHILMLVLAGWVVLRVFTWTPPHWRIPPVQAARASTFRFWAAAGRKDGGADDGFGRGLVSLASFSPAGLPLEAPVGMPQYRPILVPVPVYYGGQWPSGSGAIPQGMRPAVLASAGEGMFMPAVWRDDSPGGSAPSGARQAAVADPALVGQTVPDAATPVPLSPGLAEGKADRWSADTWMLARRDSAVLPVSGRPVYGGSQAGAVLRYRLAPSSAHRPLAYLRGSTALGTVRESELALGFGLRPVPAIPVMVAAEARGFRSAAGKTSFRPAALAYTEIPPFALPLGFTGEAYAQGGYVGGQFETAFVDGQIRADRPLFSVAGTTLRIGAGAWGGAQKGVSRLDAGPSASATVDIWGKPSRVSMDWRFRLSGQAMPKSGPALTISAGF